MGKFAVGDMVEVIDEAIKGVIIKIADEMVTLETEDGFQLQFSTLQLVKSGNEIHVSNYEAHQIKKEKEIPKKKKSKAHQNQKNEVHLKWRWTSISIS